MSYPTPKKFETAYTATVGSSHAGNFVDTAPPTQSAPAFVPPITPEMIQQMIVSAFLALGFFGKPFSTSPPWLFDNQ